MGLLGNYFYFVLFPFNNKNNVRQNLIKCVCFEKKSRPAKKSTCFERLKQIVKFLDQGKTYPFFT